MSDFDLSQLGTAARLAVSVFLVHVLFAYLVVGWLTWENTRLQPEGVQRHYLGSETVSEELDEQFGGMAYEQGRAQMLETLHFHAVAIPLFFLPLLLTLAWSRLPRSWKLGLIGAGGVLVPADLVLPWLVRFHSAGWSVPLMAVGVVLSLIATVAVIAGLHAMWLADEAADSSAAAG